jgi:CBS domain-containing protein
LKNWDKILLKPDDTLETTIQTLHAGGKRIALVVDENNKLLGTVTDGDIRRSLIKHITLDCSVKEVMNRSPSTALASEASDLIMLK